MSSALFTSIRQLLLERWNPIGVPMLPRDEYDSYSRGLSKCLAPEHRRTKSQAYFWSLRLECTPRRRVNIASRLREIYEICGPRVGAHLRWPSAKHIPRTPTADGSRRSTGVMPPNPLPPAATPPIVALLQPAFRAPFSTSLIEAVLYVHS